MDEDHFDHGTSFPVVCIIEHDENKHGKVDSTLFFAYDRRYNEYVLWGKRSNKDDVPFMFRFDTFNNMDNFIHMSILHNKNAIDKFTITLNNYNNFPLNFNVSYKFLYDNLDISYEITGYENILKKHMTRRYLRKWAHICKHSYNRIDGEIV